VTSVLSLFVTTDFSWERRYEACFITRNLKRSEQFALWNLILCFTARYSRRKSVIKSKLLQDHVDNIFSQSWNLGYLNAHKVVPNWVCTILLANFLSCFKLLGMFTAMAVLNKWNKVCIFWRYLFQLHLLECISKINSGFEWFFKISFRPKMQTIPVYFYSSLGLAVAVCQKSLALVKQVIASGNNKLKTRQRR